MTVTTEMNSISLEQRSSRPLGTDSLRGYLQKFLTWLLLYCCRIRVVSGHSEEAAEHSSDFRGSPKTTL
jgi:hypothetical protein